MKGENTPELVNGFMFGCRARGLHLTYGYGGVNFRVIPPLVITQAEIDQAVKIMEEALIAARAHPGRDAWPTNPQTSRLFEKHPLRRLLRFAWRSSPSDLVDKGKEVIRGRLGRK
jgi:hypothetical protein